MDSERVILQSVTLSLRQDGAARVASNPASRDLAGSARRQRRTCASSVGGRDRFTGHGFAGAGPVSEPGALARSPGVCSSTMRATAGSSGSGRRSPGSSGSMAAFLGARRSTRQQKPCKSLVFSYPACPAAWIVGSYGNRKLLQTSHLWSQPDSMRTALRRSLAAECRLTTRIRARTLGGFDETREAAQ